MKSHILKHRRKIIFFLSVIVLGSACIASEVKAFDRQVQLVQERLQQLSYDPGNADGLIGEKTKKALKYFQVDKDLAVTGLIDSATFSALEIEVSRGITLQRREGSEKRLALVIGNSAYKTAPLSNPANDANDMAAALQQIGFEVIKQIDADLETMEKSLETFGKRLRDADIGMFFFAGHGMQIDGTNYLIPVRARIYSESNVKYRAVNAGLILGQMKDAGTKLVITANVPGSSIEINGKSYGKVPQTLSLKEAGNYHVRISKDSGWDTWTGSVSISPGESKKVTAYLRERSTPDRNEYVQCQLPGERDPVWHKRLACIRQKGTVLDEKKTLEPYRPAMLSSAKNASKNWDDQNTYSSSYVQCILPGEHKSVWHKESTCKKMGGKTFDDIYVSCRLSGERKPVWHKWSICEKMGGKVLGER